MKFSNHSLFIDGQQVRQISKTTAKKLFYSGKFFYMMPCNMGFVNLWGYPYMANIEDSIHIGCEDLKNAFDLMYNEFVYYNCNSEAGLYPIFFTPVTD